MVDPIAALTLIAWLLASTSFAATRDVAILALVGMLLYAAGHRHRRRRMVS